MITFENKQEDNLKQTNYDTYSRSDLRKTNNSYDYSSLLNVL